MLFKTNIICLIYIILISVSYSQTIDTSNIQPFSHSPAINTIISLYLFLVIMTCLLIINLIFIKPENIFTMFIVLYIEIIFIARFIKPMYVTDQQQL